ncbi:MAG: hypothetical protein OHK0038_12500 [Flammeovirgaceae bacterium]
MFFVLLSFVIENVFAWQQNEKKAISQTDSLKKAAKTQKRTYTTRLASQPPHIDGFLNDETWNSVEWATNFTQREPADGEEPTYQTAFKVLYDERNLYVAIRAYDSEPDKIARRMSRRDGFDGDFVELNIDSYNDKRTAFSFSLSASGVIGDEAISNNGENWDSSWDPIWWGKTNVDELGWTAEIRIPLSQLRFANNDDMTWGFQVLRMNFRKQERSYWQYIPQNSTGWVHLFGELNGLKGIKPQKQLEIMPYIVAKNDQYPIPTDEKDNPFLTGNESKITTGVDAKIGITSDITLDLTVNPDFGQVEADPSQVNLTAFEVFFQERRPFFVESRNILDYQLSRGPVGGSFNIDNLLYSRRIGRNPSYYPDTDKTSQDTVREYVKQPNQTRILGAAKLTGKNKNGFSFGLMEAFTEKTYSKIDSLGHRRKEAVEPFTNYLVARAQKDFKEGRTVIGGIFTNVYRKIDEAHLEFIRKEAYSSGIDFLHHFDKDRKYFLSGNVVFSHIKGSKKAIYEAQTSNRRLFQRPDANYLSVNENRTSLSGHGGMVRFGKRGGDNFRYETGITWRSPGLELNDVGFLRQADVIRHWAQVSYQQLKPNQYFRRFFANITIKEGWDFGGKNLSQGVNGEINVQLNNFWWLGLGAEGLLKWVSNNDLRGGPAIRYPGGAWIWGWADTNYSKKLAGSMGMSAFVPDQGYNHNVEIWGGFRYRISNALEVSFYPNASIYDHELQYVTTVSNANQNSESRYIVAKIDQKTVSAQFRVNLVLRPNLSIQYYGQPFAFIGRYKDFKKITNASDAQYLNRFVRFTSLHIKENADGGYDIDEDLNGITDYQIDKPDFDFSQFRQNFVLRWEYIPGSVFFAVWAINGEATDFQNKTTLGSTTRFAADMITNAYHFSPMKAHHTFLIKYTYRFRL